MSPDLYIALQFVLGFGLPMAFAVREILCMKPAKEPPFNGGEPTVVDIASRRPAKPVPQVIAVADDSSFKRAA